MASEGGLRVYSSVGIGAGSAPTIPFKIITADATDIFEGDLVKMVTSTANVVAATAVGDVAIVGVFRGCEYTNTDGQRVQSNKYLGTTNPITQEDTIAFVDTNPHQVYKVKFSDTDVDTVQTRGDAVGLKWDIEFNAGNATTGMSGMTLDSGTGGVVGDAQVVCIGVINEDGTDGAKGAAAATFTHGLVVIDSAVSIYGESAGV